MNPAFTPMMVAGNGYQAMPQRDNGQFTQVLEGSQLVKSESMEMTNDPRFFTDNVLDKRLMAFASLSVVSGLMVQNAMDTAFGMNKEMDFRTVDGILQFVGFLLICLVLFFNMLATYIGVAQPYHTYRLMTAGPTGFEAAAAYYLHKDIISWRHLSIKLMLISLPIYLASSGLRFVVKFDRDNSTSPPLGPKPPMYTRIEGFACLACFTLVGLALAQVHWRHEEIFKHIYDTIYNASGVSNMMSQVQQLMSARLRTGGTRPLDV